MGQWCGHWGVEVWAYCLMPNHVHLIVVPPAEEALRRAIGEAHRRYTRRVNFREGWRGHLWQGRFGSFPMDDGHLLWMAARYVELNPVRAGLAQGPEAYGWSSARAHLAGRDDGLVRVGPLIERFGDWGNYLARGLTDAQAGLFRRHERTGRPMGDEGFVARIDKLLGRVLHRRKPGPKGPRSIPKPRNLVCCPAICPGIVRHSGDVGPGSPGTDRCRTPAGLGALNCRLAGAAGQRPIFRLPPPSVSELQPYPRIPS